MASMGDIKHSIRSISETEQITRAMHLISTSKMKKAINKYDSNHMHFERVQAALKDILTHSHELRHPYIGESEHGRAAYVVIAADKGLCGGYNHNVLNLAYEYMQQSEERYILTVGQEARAFFNRKNYMIDVEFLHVSQNPSLYNARNITNDILELYDNGLMDEVYVVYTQFHSVLHQEPKVFETTAAIVVQFQGRRHRGAVQRRDVLSPHPQRGVRHPRAAIHHRPCVRLSCTVVCERALCAHDSDGKRNEKRGRYDR